MDVLKLYDRFVAPHFDRDPFQIYQESRQCALAQLKKHLSIKNFRGLDLGVGTGELLLALTRFYPEAELFGIEGAPQMLKIARGKLRKQKLERTPRLIQGDACHLGRNFSPESMDLITMHFLLNFLEGEQALRMVGKTLRRGGFLSLATTTQESFSRLKGLALHFTTEEEIQAQIHVPADLDGIAAMLDRHGFTLLERQDFYKHLVFESFDQLYEFVLYSGWLLSPRLFELQESELNAAREFGKDLFPLQDDFRAGICLARRR